MKFTNSFLQPPSLGVQSQLDILLKFQSGWIREKIVLSANQRAKLC